MFFKLLLRNDIVIGREIEVSSCDFRDNDTVQEFRAVDR